jgi:hypothetical protein
MINRLRDSAGNKANSDISRGHSGKFCNKAGCFARYIGRSAGNVSKRVRWESRRNIASRTRLWRWVFEDVVQEKE